jgi:F0F1-type ATP synthase assembly protein I
MRRLQREPAVEPIRFIDHATVRRQAYFVVGGQVLVALAGAAICFVWRGMPSAQDALTGGLIGASATLAQVLVGLRDSAGREAQEVVRNFYRGSAVKFAVTVMLFVWALRGRRVDAAPLFVTYVATFFVYRVALAKSLTPRTKLGD